MTATFATIATHAAYAKGVATIAYDGTVLDVWYPAPKLGDQQQFGASRTTRIDEPDMRFRALVGPDEHRGVARIAVATTIADLSQPAIDAYDAYLRLHLLSHRLIAPHEAEVAGISQLLTTAVWTNHGPCEVADFQLTRARLAARGPVTVYSVDKFPRMVDYVVPSEVLIGDADRVRLGAYLAPGTTVLHEGLVGFNAGTLGPCIVEGRIAPGVVVGEGTKIAGGAAITSACAGGGQQALSLGKHCRIGANASVGISLGDACVVEPGIYLNASTTVTISESLARLSERAPGTRIKAFEMAGKDGLVFYRSPLGSAIEVTTTAAYGSNDAADQS